MLEDKKTASLSSSVFIHSGSDSEFHWLFLSVSIKIIDSSSILKFVIISDNNDYVKCFV